MTLRSSSMYFKERDEKSRIPVNQSTKQCDSYLNVHMPY